MPFEREIKGPLAKTSVTCDEYMAGERKTPVALPSERDHEIELLRMEIARLKRELSEARSELGWLKSPDHMGGH